MMQFVRYLAEPLGDRYSQKPGVGDTDGYQRNTGDRLGWSLQFKGDNADPEGDQSVVGGSEPWSEDFNLTCQRKPGDTNVGLTTR